MPALQNTPTGSQLKLPGITFQTVAPEHNVAKFDITVSLNEMEDGTLRGGFDYNTDLFNAETIERMIRCFVMLLREAEADRTTPLRRLSMLSNSEKHRILA